MRALSSPALESLRKMRRIRISQVVLTMAVVLACAGDNLTMATAAVESRSPSQPTPLDSLSTTMAQSGVREYRQVPDSLLWEFIVASDSTAHVGLKRPGAQHGVLNGASDVTDAERREAMRTVLAVPGVVLEHEDSIAPTIRVRIRNRQAIRALRSLPIVSYLEPR